MTKWQYRAVRVVAPSGDEVVHYQREAKAQGWTDLQAHTAISAQHVAWLNELGNQGWEAVGITSEASGKHEGAYTILLKRAVVE